MFGPFHIGIFESPLACCTEISLQVPRGLLKEKMAVCHAQKADDDIIGLQTGRTDCCSLPSVNYKITLYTV